MRPLNFAVLKHFTEVEVASVDDVMNALKADYGSYKQFTKKALTEALMLAEQNYILEEVTFELDEEGKCRFFYKATEDGAKTINSYIK